MSIVVSDIGATDFIAVAGGTYRYGLAQANFDWLGSMPALLIAAFLIVPFYWRSGGLHRARVPRTALRQRACAASSPWPGA